MTRTAVNPWQWQQKYGFTQTWRVEGVRTLLFVSGQGPVDANGAVVGEGDFEAQVRTTIANLETVLTAAGGSLDSILKMTTYLTDVSQLADYARIRAELVTGTLPASTVIGVSGLAFPGMQIEIDVVAAL